ncbi:YbaL family putative K(+) efflux transporter [Deinococcus soli (ex Cha et al. 2016)]|uniref:YbaL family putative K(+) efflux transporter n=1 Tax=Deinococcus soli (ex Cha et al. 2016) TaxID=1309411 RepID=UPI001666B807|nr:YbaL family putative K(+) efflux transporter [Deinococcus soli (ex Cha et al. 2016)]GGB82453.1 potassium efflux transporter [Deinococcus soli (ex Cha et al. 2016)]
MPHHTELIAALAVGLTLAFLGGLLATRLRLPPLIGYLLAGIVVGPFTPGFVADANIAAQLSEIGVILLMFGVGLHFSFGDLLAVRRIAVPGALVQIAVATLLGLGVTQLWGWSLGQGLVFGLALSVASTVVLLRALEERGTLDTEKGKIAVGWLVVEDLVMVLTLVLLPALAPLLKGTTGASLDTGSLLSSLLLTVGKVAVFVALMMIAGRRFIPWMLARVARLGSRELFTLAVLGTALGIAYGAGVLFDVSFALGAFFAGVVVSESKFSHQAAEDALPFQDAFAVLFFVSVGMLFNPAILLTAPLLVLATALIIIVGKTLAAFLIVRLLRYPVGTALTVAFSLAQIGEFSFILAALGRDLNLLSEQGQNLILAGAIVSITLNPFLFRLITPLKDRLERRSPAAPGASTTVPEGAAIELHGHAVIVGYGRVGRLVGQALQARHLPFVIVEQDDALVEDLRAQGLSVIYGDAARTQVLRQAGLPQAGVVIVATPDALQAQLVTEHVRRVNPQVHVIARTHDEHTQQALEQLGANEVLFGEQELGQAIGVQAVMALGTRPVLSAPPGLGRR